MIVAVCLNAALDVTYALDHLVPGETHRAAAARERAGGKGVNVATVAAQLGSAVRVCGFAGGATGDRVRADLALRGVEDRMTEVAGETRRCVTLVDPYGATVVNEAGPQITTDEWRLLRERAQTDWEGASVVVLSGSIPPGLPDDAYATLTALAHRVGACVVLDASGPPLTAALAAGPDIAKPNAAEAAAALGRPVDTALAATEAARALRTAGARRAVVSRGADGLVAVTDDGVLRACPPRRVAGNPTGAGDALTAALACGLATDTDWTEILRDAVATSAAAVAAELAGDIDPTVRVALRPHVIVEES